MIRSTRSSDRAAIAFPPNHIATPEQTPSVCGTTTPARWLLEIAKDASLKAISNNLAMPHQGTSMSNVTDQSAVPTIQGPHFFE
jgi:hypothetical protein